MKYAGERIGEYFAAKKERTDSETGPRRQQLHLVPVAEYSEAFAALAVGEWGGDVIERGEWRRLVEILGGENKLFLRWNILGSEDITLYSTKMGY